MSEKLRVNERREIALKRSPEDPYDPIVVSARARAVMESDEPLLRALGEKAGPFIDCVCFLLQGGTLLRADLDQKGFGRSRRLE